MLNEELIKFYKENNYNPASGCLPVLVQLPILISLYQVIMKPLRYLFGMSDDNIKALAKIVNGFITKSADKLDIKAMDLNIQIINYFHNNWDKLEDSNVANI